MIFSSDADYIRLHDQGVEHAGIAYCHQQRRSIGAMIRALELIWEVYEPDETRNRIEYI